MSTWNLPREADYPSPPPSYSPDPPEALTSQSFDDGVAHEMPRRSQIVGQGSSTPTLQDLTCISEFSPGNTDTPAIRRYREGFFFSLSVR